MLPFWLIELTTGSNCSSPIGEPITPIDQMIDHKLHWLLTNLIPEQKMNQFWLGQKGNPFFGVA